jgi:hypothetical protein
LVLFVEVNVEMPDFLNDYYYGLVRGPHV